MRLPLFAKRFGEEQKRMNRRIRSLVDDSASHTLLSPAVVNRVNESSFNVTIGDRWTPSSSFSFYTLKAGAGQYFSTTATASLTRTVQYDGATDSFLSVDAYGGSSIYSGPGTPPVSAAKIYDFVNTPGTRNTVEFIRP
jgi:hypothetical protein